MLAALSAHRLQEQQAFAQKIPETFVTNSLDIELQSLCNTSQPRHGTHIGQDIDWQKKASSEVMLLSKKRNTPSVLPSQQNKCIVPKPFPQKLPNTMLLALDGTKIISSSPSQKQQVSCQTPLKHEDEGNPPLVPFQQLGTIKKLPGRSCSVPAKLVQDCKFQAAEHQECKAPSPGMSLFPIATSTPFFKWQGARSVTEANGHHTDSGISMSFSSQCFPTSSNSESSVGTTCSEKTSSEESDQLAKNPDDSSQDVFNMTPDDTKDGVDSQNTSLSSMHWLKDFALKPQNSSDNDPQTPSVPLPSVPNTYSRAKVGSCSRQAESDAEKTKRPPHTFVSLIKLALATQQ
ncbi:uncharacterized protein LOC112559023 [Pomacea canaliculata]|uniref:uncharacterized protein LOC112559023 n=1 Tax=Pomacea canaliculata TaxID=400727 RepID=UPI000D73F253|nr:uncharacterized protein LOC112559023 [Pomacea canaliculata]